MPLLPASPEAGGDTCNFVSCGDTCNVWHSVAGHPHTLLALMHSREKSTTKSQWRQVLAGFSEGAITAPNQHDPWHLPHLYVELFLGW